MRTVALLDDDDVYSHALIRALAKEGFECLRASNVSDLAAQVLLREVVAVILAADLPEQGCAKALKAVGSSASTRGLPILVLDPQPCEDRAFDFYHDGADLVLHKPPAVETVALLKPLVQ